MVSYFISSANLLYSLNLLPYLQAPKAGDSADLTTIAAAPLLTAVIALYQEKSQDIDMTLSSLAAQTYPKDRYEILLAIEPDDESVVLPTQRWVDVLTRSGIFARVIMTDGKAKTKPHALNEALAHARGEFCVFYDASDMFPAHQLEDGIALMVGGAYDVAQAKVVRKGDGLLDHFLLLETVFWHWRYVPFVHRWSHGFPLSGEGLFVRTSVLREAGLFPQVLTEDALLGLNLTERGRRFATLDSVVIEKAPRDWKSHFHQKLRWQRGYLTCLGKLLVARMPWRQKVGFGLAFSTPIAAGLALLGWLCVLADFVVLSGDPAGMSLHMKTVQYWSWFLGAVGIPVCVFISIRLARGLGIAVRVWLPILLPAYWLFVGVCAICACFRGTKHWGKTQR